MNNITVSVDPTTYRRARMHAAANATSVSALVRDYLTGLSREESPTEKLKREEAAWRARITAFSGAARLSRDEVHERAR